MSEQSMQALKLADKARFDARDVRREVAAGVLTIADALEDPRSGCLQVGRLLCCQYAWGPNKAHRLLNREQIWPTRRVRDLTPRQRQAIARAVGS